MGVQLTIHQPSYSILNRWIEDDGTLNTLGELGVGCIAFSPLAQGVLSGKYSKDKVKGTRAGEANSSLFGRHLEPGVLAAVDALQDLADQRGQTLVQLALAWVLRRQEMTSALIGVRTLEQLKDNLGAINNLELSDEELKVIDKAAEGGMMNLHPQPGGWLR
jgi:L-glyceraldehyde 3-phosphate reductase